MPLTGKSQVYGILGDPIAHSLSPLMQNRALASLGIDAVYVPFHVLPNQLSEAVQGLRALQIAGVNVTIPHKESIIPLLDEVDERARLIGAVNTIVNRQGRLVGYNTDGAGFLASVREELGFQPEQGRVLLVGAGGACRAAVVALAAAGVASIHVANRSIVRASQMVKELSSFFPQTEIRAFALNDILFKDSLKKADLIVNTTSLGLKKERLDFLPLENIKPSALIFDMVYSRAETPLLQSARARGLSAVDGLGMLAGQGEEAFFLWTGKRPAAGLMRQCLQEYRTNDESS